MAKVSLVRCEDYSQDRVDKAVAEAIEKIGGIENFIKKDEKVLIKVNLLMLKTKEEAVTTHPAVLEAVLKQILKQTKNIVVGDSPAFSKVEKIAEKAGILEVCERYNIRLSNLGKGINVKNPEGRIKTYTVCEETQKFDKIVNISKLKTHSLAIMTNATKNLFGFIPGMLKPQFHLKFQDRDSFSEMIIDLGLLFKPCLNVTDAIVCMEGEGPSSGTPKQLGLVMASGNCFALDFVAAEITGLDVPLVYLAKKRKLKDIDNIEVIGDVRDFKTNFISPAQKKMPHFLLGMAKTVFVKKPKLSKKKCIRCQACYKICPAGAIQMDPFPQFDYKICVRCYCCHEYCPKKAIRLSRF